MNISTKLLKSKLKNQTVFTIDDIMMLVPFEKRSQLDNALYYAVHRNQLLRLSEGIYALSDDYSLLELGNKYRRPSYVSSYTILQEVGIVFQPYTSIYLMSNRFEESEIDEQKYIYHQIKDTILLNPLGLYVEDNIQKATPERAICDKIYLTGIEYFDNLRNIDWNLIKRLNEKVYEDNKEIDKFLKLNSK